jgi:hypothetical protein
VTGKSGAAGPVQSARPEVGFGLTADGLKVDADRVEDFSASSSRVRQLSAFHAVLCQGDRRDAVDFFHNAEDEMFGRDLLVSQGGCFLGRMKENLARCFVEEFKHHHHRPCRHQTRYGSVLRESEWKTLLEQG